MKEEVKAKDDHTEEVEILTEQSAKTENIM